MIDSFKNNLLIGLLLLLFSSSFSFASGHFVFSVDKSGVYCVTGYGVTLLEGADKESFQRVGSRDSFYGRMDRFAKDQNHVYNFCQRQEGISPVGFDVLHQWQLVRTHDQVYYGKYAMVTFTRS